MTMPTNHQLVFDYKNNTVSATCSCGGWEWDAKQNKRLFPLQAFTLVRVEHQQHVEAVARLRHQVEEGRGVG